MASYNDGLYTPWTPAGDGGAATTSAAAWAGDTAATSSQAAADTWAATTTTSAEDTWAPETTTTQAAWSTSMTPAWSAQETTTSAWAAWSPSTTTTTPAWTPASSSTSQWSASTTNTPPASSTSTTSSSTPNAPASASSAILSSVNKYATVSRYASPSGAALSSSSSHNSSFKMTYLIPAFVVVPLALLFVILGCTYGKWWGRGRKGSQTPLSEGVGGMGWWGGRGGSWRSRRSGYDDDDAEETGGLVGGGGGGEKYGDAMDEYDEKRFTLPSVDGREAGATRGGGGGGSRWSNFFAPSSTDKHAPRPDVAVPFLSVSHASTPEQPFVPPSRSSSTQDFPRWTARGAVAPQGPTTSGGFLAAGAWGTGARSNRQHGLARNVSGRSTTSVGSRLSDRIFGRFGMGGRSPDVCPSPSVYSPTPEESAQSHQSFGAAGAYMGVHMEDEDEDDFADEKQVVDYDAFLAAGRVGDGELARRYAKGEIKDSDIFAPRDPPRYPEGDARERYYARQGPVTREPFTQPDASAPPSFAIDLPAAPSRLQVSPKKTASTLLRPAPPETPEKGNLLFSYASPPPPQPQGSPRPPLPPIPQQHKKVSPTKGALTEPPARTPFRQQTAPQLVRPPRHHDPFAPEPNWAFSQDVYDPIIETAGKAEHPSSRRGGATTTSSRSATPTKQSQRATPVRSNTDVRPGILVSSASELQARKTPSRESIPRSSSVSPTKDLGRRREAPPSGGRSRPVSAYAQLPSQAQKEHEVRKIPSRQDLRPISMAKSRESLAFDAAFADPAPIAPLQHPNKVRAAVENIETRETPSASTHRKTPSRDSGRSAVSDRTTSSGGRLGRSATTVPSTTTYRRPLGNKGLVSDDDSDSDDSEAIITNRRLSMLILNRSKSQSGSFPSGPGSGDSHGSTTLEDEDRAARPLSSDPRRLSAMLRRPSQGGALQREDEKDEESEVKGGAGGLFDALKRRSGIFDDAD